jgi:hypothetical protein
VFGSNLFICEFIIQPHYVPHITDSTPSSAVICWLCSPAYYHKKATIKSASLRMEAKRPKTEKQRPSISASSLLLLLLPWLQLDNLIEVQYALPLVHFRGFAASNGACEIVDRILVDAGAAYYVGFEAEDADRGWSSELHLMAVAQFQKQLTALGLWPCFETNPNELQKPEKLGFHLLPSNLVIFGKQKKGSQKFLISHQNYWTIRE